ncbi:DNA cross-link repair 1A protein-like [Xyrauchen texanus]|uniref:DNA cross-link repair 1A protein-like n=1 Tax=Xyrauchen texanus TaxID=154827 RepID=UPI002242AE8B|nr:DNA cross-link repair 1A protein-like [Xyrauchen texanus]
MLLRDHERDVTKQLHSTQRICYCLQMSQNDSESDIWDYKPLKKTKRRSSKSQIASKHGTKRRKRAKSEVSAQKPKLQVNSAETHTDLDHNAHEISGKLEQESVPTPLNVHGTPDQHVQEEEPQSTSFCPVCQMPFSILVVQSQQWHVAECLDTPGEDCKECPNGLQCSSSIPSHYKRYSHSLLAHSRALNCIDGSAPTQSCTVKSTSDFSLKSLPFSDVACTSSSVDSAVNVSALSSKSSSPGDVPKETPIQTNALLLLHSPNSDDIKKKKGWSPSTKRSQSQNSSQEARMKISTPVKAQCVDSTVQTQTSEVKEELSAFNDDDYISYSPLSELPDVDEERRTQGTKKKLLFHSTVLHGESEIESDDDSLKLFSDEDDDLLKEMLDQYESEDSKDYRPFKDSLNTCMKSQTLLAPENQLITSSSTGVSDGTCQHGSLSQPTGIRSTTNIKVAKTQLQSPQSLVLEHLREHISNPAHTNGLGSLCGEVKSTYLNQELSSTQTALSTTQKSVSMASRRTQTKAGNSGLKQTDIGVFFGLKPLHEKKVDEEVKATFKETDEQGSRTARVSGDTKQQGRWLRKNRAPSEVSSVSATAEYASTQPTQTEGGRGRRAAGWKRWNMGRATDGGPEKPNRCPFYKKIPGTTFAVDAFQYGLAEGVTAYFLTHFHSDHYCGLKKDSVFPIYCNKITGNLVKSKLKVDEHYIHVLPMNTVCTVQGVKVTLLDANHCPGAVMLLFVLPDGQTVFHTGDFRADPSMERYPELQDLRIKTLYLDTTYCSPEYTFPTQQEVITFAVNVAFEQVTLNPRTLVVCGTYTIGKEKVFLAVSEVLGSKVCLSRDKYNTMCCLESKQVNQRITTDWLTAQVHVLPMMQLNFKNLRTHLNKFSRKYDQIVAFKPTGWTFNQTVNVEDIQPQTQGNISIYGIPYSEHSSYLEMKRFVQWLQPRKIIPTVNVGSWKSRKAMESYFHDWQTAPTNLNSTN